MRNLFLSALLAAAFTLTGANTFAEDEQEPQDTQTEQQTEGTEQEPVDPAAEEAPPTGSMTTEEMAEQVKEVEGKVVNYNEKFTSITIETAEGETMPLTVVYPTHLEDIKPGDQVTVTVQGTSALSITKTASEEEKALIETEEDAEVEGEAEIE